MIKDWLRLRYDKLIRDVSCVQCERAKVGRSRNSRLLTLNSFSNSYSPTIVYKFYSSFNIEM